MLRIIKANYFVQENAIECDKPTPAIAKIIFDRIEKNEIMQAIINDGAKRPTVFCWQNGNNIIQLSLNYGK